MAEIEIDYILYHEILPWFHIVKVPKGISFVKNDPQDDIFIRCAVKGKADILISGDSHLLKLKESPVPTLSISDFFKTCFYEKTDVFLGFDGGL